jgi:hypothetical protein
LWDVTGRFFTFVTASNAVAMDANGTYDVYLYDLLNRSLTLASVNSNHSAAANGASDSPAMSRDGHFVIYRSYATNIVAGTTNPPPNVFLFDRFSGSNSLLTAASPGATWNPQIPWAAINGDGSVVVWASWNPGLITDDRNRVQDVFADALSPWGTTDSDGDGIPDAWMMHYFGHPTGLASDSSLAQDDADGDGLSNLAEFLAGTDPTNPESALRAQISVQVSASKSVTLNWPTVPGKNYRTQFKNNLSDASWLDTSGATVVGQQGTFTVPVDQPGRFYRVAAQ